MGRFRYSNQLFLPIMLGIPILACQGQYYSRADSDLSDHHWLLNKKIFIDIGHVASDPRGRYRIGPNNTSEGEINIRVARILADMLRTAGAKVELGGDSGEPDHERGTKARRFGPDLFLSIRHASSPAPGDAANHPAVQIWGSRDVHPASYDFASLLIDELNAIMDHKGTVISDFALFSEGGDGMLRETRHLCPGAVGEAGFYTDVKHSIHLNDALYVEKEAEAYFNAVSRYFKRGTPSAAVSFSCPVDDSGPHINLIRDEKPEIIIKTASGNELPGIEDRSLRITLDGVPIGHKKISERSFRVDYGKKLYPGIHRLRFHFRNLRHQSSMILSAPFTLEMGECDRGYLVKQGKRLVRSRATAKEGLKMLLAALSMDPTGPDSCVLVRDITIGFALIGNQANAEYFSRKHSLFYSSGCSASSNVGDAARRASYVERETKLPIEHLGKEVSVQGDASLGEWKMKKNKIEFSRRIKQFFSRQE